jgi:ABC-2 type transport system ATP-binding protein
VAALRTAGHAAERDGDGLLPDGEHAVQHPDEIAALLVAAGCPPTRLAVEQDDLETCFLHLVGQR